MTQSRVFSKPGFSALALCALGIGASIVLGSRASYAQPRIMPPEWPHPPFPRPRPVPTTTELQLSEEKAKVQIGVGFAKTTLSQTFQNTTDRQIEGTYLWAVPAGAAINDLNVTLGGKKLSAEILAGDKANEIYTGIVQKMRDPAILEFVGRDLVRARIFPIAPRAKVEVEISYSQPVANNRFDLPLRVPNATNEVRANVEISLDVPDLKAVYSPSHTVETRRENERTRVTGEWSSTDRDFSLLWTRSTDRVALNLLTSPGDDGDGFFLLLAAPDAKVSDKEIEAKDVVFVFDTSGSMDGPKIEQARRALKTLLANLRPNDRFNIVTFSSDVRTWRDGLTEASAKNIESARVFADGIKAVGGTNIGDAMQTALKMRDGKSGTRPQQIVFMTDGQPTIGETKVETLLDSAKNTNDGQARVWTFGVGFDVNTRLLDGLAEENRGAADYVLPTEDIEQKVGDLYGKIAYPVLTNTKIDWGGLDVYDVFPRNAPELFRGGQVVMMGRYKGTPKGKVMLSGQMGSEPRRFDGTIAAGGPADLSRLWATRKVGYLIDDARRAGRPIAGEVRDEILALSKKYGVVTPLTAALITEDSPMIALGGNASGPITPAMPGAMRGRGGFGGGGMGGGFGGGMGAARDATALPAPSLSAESGQGAVFASKAAKGMREGRADEVSGSKTVGGKTFVLQTGGDGNTVWTDTTITKASPKPRIVKFASAEYFTLAKDAQIARWLAIGDRITFSWKGETIRIEP